MQNNTLTYILPLFSATPSLRSRLQQPDRKSGARCSWESFTEQAIASTASSTAVSSRTCLLVETEVQITVFRWHSPLWRRNCSNFGKDGSFYPLQLQTETILFANFFWFYSSISRREQQVPMENSSDERLGKHCETRVVKSLDCVLWWLLHMPPCRLVFQMYRMRRQPREQRQDGNFMPTHVEVRAARRCQNQQRRNSVDTKEGRLFGYFSAVMIFDSRFGASDANMHIALKNKPCE
eukprot:5560423-Amphidinium_carterae.1